MELNENQAAIIFEEDDNGGVRIAGCFLTEAVDDGDPDRIAKSVDSTVAALTVEIPKHPEWVETALKALADFMEETQ